MINFDDDAVDDPKSVLTLEDPAEETASEAEAQASDPTPPSRTKRRVLAGLVALLAVAATAALVLLSISEYQHRRDDTLRGQAVAMSRDYLVAMAAFDYQKMDANREHIVANSTPASPPNTTRWSRRCATSW